MHTPPAFDPQSLRNRLKELPVPQLISILKETARHENMVISQSGRWAHNEERLANGTIGEDNYKLERNQIRHGLFYVVDHLDETALSLAHQRLPAPEDPASMQLADNLLRAYPQDNAIKNTVRVFQDYKAQFQAGQVSPAFFKEKESAFLAFAKAQLEGINLSEPPPAGPETKPAPRKRGGGKRLKKIIFFLSANPCTTAKLRLAEEYRRIHSPLQQSKTFDFRSEEQVNMRKLNAALMDESTRNALHIVHFSGHGSGSDASQEKEMEGMRHALGVDNLDDVGVILYDEELRAPKLVEADVWKDFFASIRQDCPELRTVVFNNCFSEAVARAVSETGLHVVGVRNVVKDGVAIQFSSGFYAALAEKLPLERAVAAGKRQARAEGLPSMDDITLFLNGEKVAS